MTVQNPSSGAIARHNGFVSSTGPGRLVRATYSTDVYLFPTGWNDNGNVLYRPLEITPSVTDVQSFEVRMGFGDATNEGYDISQKASNINSVNKKFFHLAKQVGSTTPSDLSIYYSISADSIWSSIGRWQVVPQWQDLEHTAFTAGFPLSHRTKKGWMDNGNQPHILINTGDAVVPFAFPNVFDPGSNDPNNATFHIINQLSLADLIDLKIFNRWGEPVFDSERDGKKEWDGKYLGKLQLMGNYVYMANVKILDTNEVKAVSGNLSLLW
jgi:gliding motility-associated-like protein